MSKGRAFRIRIGVFSLLVLLSLMPFPADAQQSPEPIGSVVALEGEVLIFHRGETRWMRARLRDKIFLNDTIHTRERAKVQLLFQDDSLLTLGESTRIEVSEHLYQPAENRRSSVFRLFTGKVRAIVGKAFSQEGSRFQVHTPTAVVGTRMTQFIVWVVSPDLTIVITLEGEVVTRNIVETVVGEAIVREGFMTQIQVNQPPREPVPAPSEQMDQLMRETRVPKAAFSARAEVPSLQQGKASAEKPGEGAEEKGAGGVRPAIQGFQEAGPSKKIEIPGTGTQEREARESGPSDVRPRELEPSKKIRIPETGTRQAEVSKKIEIPGKGTQEMEPSKKIEIPGEVSPKAEVSQAPELPPLPPLGVEGVSLTALEGAVSPILSLPALPASLPPPSVPELLLHVPSLEVSPPSIPNPAQDPGEGPRSSIPSLPPPPELPSPPGRP